MPSLTEVERTKPAITRYAIKAPAKRDDLGQGAELVRITRRDTEHLASRRTLRNHVTHLGHLAGDELHRAVHGDQPGTHDHGVTQHARDDPDDHESEHDQAEPYDGRHVVRHNPLVNDLAHLM